MPEPRLLIDQDLRAGAEIALDEAQARHVGTVLEQQRAAHGQPRPPTSSWQMPRTKPSEKRGMRVVLEELLREVKPTPDLDLLFAPVKRHATDLIVEKATELGVRRIKPVITQRTIAETVRTDRLETIAREAAEQTERFDAPGIFEAATLPKSLDSWDGSRPLIYADESGDEAGKAWGGDTGRARPIGEAVAAIKAERLALLIGPEGGFTPEERRMLRGLPYVVPVSLGPRILRAETAVIAALSVIQSTWGDWRGA